jgi:hypothetical protein
MRAALVVIALVVAAGPMVARAETCPDVPDEEVALRRSMAKEWFAKAEEAEAAGDKQSAIRRYTCSLALAPHPSTAYNLGTVAEKSGDLSAALDGFRSYLKLAPEATDRPAIEARIAALEARMAELRKDIAPKTASPVTPPAPPPAVVPPPSPPPFQGAPADTAASPHARRTAAFLVGGGAVLSLGTAIVLNVMARSNMNDCYSQWKASMTASALNRCDDAKPLAYTSYALFGVAGAAAVVSGALFLSMPEAPGAPEEASEVALGPAPLPGGAALVASGRF